MPESGCTTYLVASPLHPSHEGDETTNAEHTADVVNLLQDLCFRLAKCVDSRGREIEEQGHEEAQAVPDTDDYAAVPPAFIVLMTG